MTARSRIEMLGGLQIVQASRIITRFRTQKTAGLLAYLAYYRDRSHPREYLIEVLWPGAELRSGRNCLSLALSSLRHQLEPPGVPHGAILRADRSSVQLNPDAVSTDVAEFEAARQKASQAGNANERLLFLADAVELYRGELVPGCFEEWCLTERERLAAGYLEILHSLVELLEATGDLDRALGYARRAVSGDPLHEEGHRDVMRLLAAAGQPTAALRQYRELDQRLAEELGEEPSAAIRDLARQIQQDSAGLSKSVRPSVKARAARPPRASALPPRLPSGTVTFLLTDVEGSTAQWERGGDLFTAALAIHHTLLRRVFQRFGGYEVKEAGDGFLVAFERPSDALACAVAGQQALAEQSWPKEVGALRVRMALHTGEVELQAGDYHGLVFHYASRLLAAGHGGQILCSAATAYLVQRNREPGIRLTDLGVYRLRDVETPESLFQVENRHTIPQRFPPIRAESGYARTLPLQFDRFVGRERELEQLQELLLTEGTRLVTLTGPGGTGKSRLALELASRLVERFHGAVWFVPLADLSDARQMIDAVLGAVRVPRSPFLDPAEQAVEILSLQPSLLVLDNLEHLVAEGAAVVQVLLERIPSLKCMVTSRQRLNLAAEREFGVPPLEAPEAADTAEHLSTYESVQLFIDRAQTVKPDFQVTNQNAAAVAALCHRLEGIPLAIELAAARALVLTPAQMLRQLAHRFDFLVSRRRDGVARHQTLRTAIDWSHRLLAPEMQRFFARLSVFRGGWTVEAAEAVCESGAPEGAGNTEAQGGGLTLDYLAQLQECSLVSVTENGEENRFWMLETLREFGEESLEASGEAASLHQRHARFFLALAQEAEPHLLSGDDPAWMRRLEAEYENVRTALEWMQHEERDIETGLRVASGALYTYWTLSHRLGEGRERLRALLALPGPSVAMPVRATALRAAAGLAAHQRDHVAARSLYEDALALWRELGDDPLIAWTLSGLAWNARQRGDVATARSLAEESVEVLQRLGNHEDLMLQLANLADHTHAHGDHATAHALYQRSLAILHELKDQDSPRMRSHMVGLANTAFSWGEVDKARGLYEEVLSRSREAEDKRGIAGSLYWLGRVAQEQGDYGAAYSLCKESLARWHELQDRLYATGTLESLAVLALLRGQPERASRLFGALEAYRESIGQPARSAVYRESIGQPARSAVHGRVVQDVDRHVSTARDFLGEDGFAAMWAEGRALTFEQAVTYALEE